MLNTRWRFCAFMKQILKVMVNNRLNYSWSLSQFILKFRWMNKILEFCYSITMIRYSPTNYQKNDARLMFAFPSLIKLLFYNVLLTSNKRLSLLFFFFCLFETSVSQSVKLKYICVRQTTWCNMHAIFVLNNNKLPVVYMFSLCISSRRRHHHRILCREGMHGWCFTYRIMVKLCSMAHRLQLVQVRRTSFPSRQWWWWSMHSRLNIKKE
jgi:hypothetical protein